MPLTVLNVAWPSGHVGPDAGGGAGQILHQLDRGLVRAGHRSIVVARTGSDVAGELVAGPVSRVLDRTRVDVVHLHGHDFAEHLPPDGVPVVATLHRQPSGYPGHVFALERPRTSLVCVSASQARRCPPGTPGLVATIPHGVPTDALAVRSARGGFALAVGRICPEKNVHVALEAGARARVQVLLAGEVCPDHASYFHEQIAPRLDERRRFLGPIGFAHKRLLMAAADCVLVPWLAEETSSLVAMESLACGTPVIAFRSGALPEIVEDGVTGFLVDDGDAMADAIRRARSIEPEICRRTARARFSGARMVGEYLDLYRRLSA